MEEFGLTDKFNIDDGELYGMSLQTCFVLGFEYGSMYNWAKSGPSEGTHNFIVHAENGERIESLLTKVDFSYEIEIVNDEWSSVTIEIEKVDKS